MMKDRNQRVIPRFTQEWHDDQWVKAKLRDLEEFKKYFQRKRQFDKSEEAERLYRVYQELRRLIGVVYLDEDS